MVEPLELVPHLTTDPLGTLEFMSLDRFNRIALNLAEGHAANHRGRLSDPGTFESEEAQKRFVSFVLTGKDPDSGNQAMIDLDRYRANLLRASTNLEIKGDFDSCLFASDNLPYAHPLMLMIWPPKFLVDHSLKQTYKLHRPNGKFRRVPLSHIPNIPFASCASRHIVRLYLPAEYHNEPFLYDETWPDRLYDHVTFPTIRRMHNHGFDIDPHRFPSSSQSEHYRATRRSGRPVHSDFPISTHLLPEFSKRFMRALRKERWGRNAFFFHQLRQTKGYGGFAFGDREAAEEVLEDVTQYFDSSQLHIDRNRPPTVDVGMEFGRPGHVTLIRTICHTRILHRFVNPPGGGPQVGNMQLMEKLRRSSYFSRDLTALLTDAAGFRCGQTRASHIEYLQAYNTEKNPTYLVDNGKHAKFIQPREFLAMYRKEEKTIEHMERICTIFEECAQKQDSYPARVEPRVLYEDAHNHSIDQDFAKDISLCIPNQTWWMNKLLRQKACKIGLEWILQAEPESISRPGVLMLIGTLIYISNALCARPEEGTRQRLIEHAALPHRNGVPSQRCGMFFIRQLDFLDDGCPTIVDVRGTHSRIHQLFSFGSQEDLNNFLYPSTSLISIPAHIIEARRGIPHNKSVLTKKIYLAEDIQPEFDIPEEENVVQLPRVEDINGDPIDNLSLFVTNIWRQLFSDLGEKSWQPRARELPYTRRTREEKKNMALFYSGFDLKQRFRCVSFRNQKYKEDWDKTFENLFPGPNHSFPLVMQGYNQMTYFNQYMDLHRRCLNEGIQGESELETIRSELKRKFNWLVFMPYAQSTRIFDSRQQRGSHIRIPKEHSGACPIIAINPRFAARIEEMYVGNGSDDEGEEIENDEEGTVENAMEVTSESGDDAMFVDVHELIQV
ncbi:hypothetical protein ACEPAI_8208 [Sanghuangporus weigelae]